MEVVCLCKPKAVKYIGVFYISDFPVHHQCTRFVRLNSQRLPLSFSHVIHLLVRGPPQATIRQRQTQNSRAKLLNP